MYRAGIDFGYAAMSADPLMTLIDVRDGVVACRVCGEGPPLLLLHPSAMDSRLWSAQVGEFAATQTVIAFDQRGHGCSPPSTGAYDPEEDVVAVLAMLGVERPAVLAMGDSARVALGLAIQGDVTVRALVLAIPDVGALAADDPDFDADERLAAAVADPRLEAIFQAASARDSERLAQLLGDDPSALPPGHPARVLVRAMAKDNVQNIFRETSMAPFVRDPNGLAVRTLILTNKRRRLSFTESGLRQYLRNLVEAELPTNCDLINLEQPERFNAEVLRFLSG